MTKLEYNNLSPGTLVICPEEDWDMPYGWSDEVSDMVGVVLPVKKKRNLEGYGLGVTLANPHTGNTFTFNHTHLDVRTIKSTIKKFESFSLNGYRYKQKQPINDDVMSFLALGKDRKLFKKHILQEDNIQLTKEVYHKIKKHCPRIIGVLLGNKIVVKYKEKNEDF